MVSMSTALISIFTIIIFSNDLRLLGGHVIVTAARIKKAASHILMATESFQNIYNDSPKMRKHVRLAARNARKAVKQARKVVKHSKKAISRAQIIWEKAQIWTRKMSVMISY